MPRIAAAVVCVVLAAIPAFAQTPAPAPTAKLVVTVLDQSGGLIPTAAVTIVGIEDATRAATIAPVRTSDKGAAAFENLKPGRYAISADFSGFEPNTLKDVRLRAGENKQAIILALKRVTDSVTVTQDRQIAGSDRGVSFGSALTREQIEMLSDDKEEMRRQLMELAGVDATIRVDSFEGQQLPNKAQIKSIRISRDQFAAETHFPGHSFIDIITQPGIGPIRTFVYGSFRNSAMEARNPFAPAKGPAANYNYSGNIGGSLIRDRAQFSLGGSRFNSYRTPNLYAATPSGGTQSENLNLKTVSDEYGMNGQLDYALTKDQTVRVSMDRFTSTSSNQGVGNYDRFERAYSSKSSSLYMRVSEAGPIGRRMFINSRFSLSASDSSSVSFSEAQARNVLDAFNEGGAQRKGGTYSRNFMLASDLDYVRGLHSWRTGIQVDGARYRSDAITNYVGTYTFESVDAYNAGTPRSFTQRVGNPNIEYWNFNVGVYIQDDIRIRKNFSVSPGVRFEVQTHLKDYNNVSPRLGFTWSPFKSGRTTIRSSFGIFYDWISTGTYQTTITNDGQHIREINVINPLYPDPGIATSTAPVNLYQYGNNMAMARTLRFSFSGNQTISRRMSISGTFAETRGYNLLVGSNANAPVSGVRPDPAFANIFLTNALGESRGRTLSMSGSLNLGRLATPGAPPPPPSSGPSAKFFDWRRSMFVSGSYNLGKATNNTDGAFSVPAAGDLALEWGPSLGDIRHRMSMSFSSAAFKNVSLRVGGSWSSAPPINIRTGTDDNGDLIFNDRPAGVGRNSERTVTNWSTNMGVSYSLGFGRAAVPMPGGVMITSVNGVMTAAPAQAPPAQPRYRLGISFNLNNLTNRRNPTGFSGVITSPFFLKPTNAVGARSANLNFNLSF